MAFIAAVFEKLISSDLFEFVTDDRVRVEITNWVHKLTCIKQVLADAEEMQMQSKAVKSWLADLQDLAYDVEDILDEFATEALGRKSMKEHQASSSAAPKLTWLTGIHSRSIKSNSKMMSKIEEITGRLEGLEVRKGDLQLTSVVTNDVGRPRTIPRRPPSTSLINETHVHGRDKDKEAILDLLLRNDGSDARVYSVIPIVGMGGIGKTTLAQLVYNDNSIKDYFDLRAWVCVSDDFDITRITKTILESLTSESCDTYDLDLLQVKLKKRLLGKKFLLVLDDVWNEKYTDWVMFRSPFDAGEPGSKIIVTTRSSTVSSKMRTVAEHSLNCLSEEDSLSILARYALGRENFTGHPYLEEIGLEIVKKCNFMPLAIRSVGGLLRRRANPDAWKNILENDTWNKFQKQDGIIPALWLSYRHLPSRLKQCFVYCSLIPKDYEFSMEEIVLLWVAEGFLSGANSENGMEDLGNEYFQELVSRSFFQTSSKDKSLFVMHDWFNDLARWVGGDKYCKRERLEDKMLSSQTRHCSYIMGLENKIKKSETLFEAKVLRTFFPFDTQKQSKYYLSKNVLSDLLSRLKCLRVLSLKRYNITEIPDIIGNLRLIRYLDFSYTNIKGLPDTICTLYNLQTLLLRCCKWIEKLPLEIGNLINLRHLDIAETFSLRGMPIRIGELTNLQTLSRFVLAPGDGSHMRAMKNLLKLKGELSISGLEYIPTSEDALEAGLGDKLGLKRLKLKWSDNFDRNLSKGVETKAWDKLRPPKGLEELTVEGYGGTLFPNWVGDHSFSNLLFLELKNCRRCTSMPSIGKLPLLRELRIRGCKNMISVGAEFYGDNLSNAFSSLETLCFEDMLEWKEWNPCGVDGLPRLRALSIRSCPNLTGRLPSCLPSLEKLVIRGCQELEVSVSNFPVLRELEIDGCKNLLAHRSAVKSSSLKEVSVSNILELTCLGERLMLWFRNIESLEISGCEKLISLWPDRMQLLAHMGSLVDLKIPNPPKLGILEAEEDEEELQVEIPRSVDYLNLSLMSRKLPKASHFFTSLKKLRIERCPELVSFSEVCFPITLERLVISSCEKLQYFLQEKEEVININNNSLLEHLEIKQCPSLVSLSTSLLSIWFRNKQIEPGSKLASLSSGAKILAGIKQLLISACPKLESISGELLVGLQRLQVWNCSKLKAFSQSGKLPEKLKSLQIISCPSLTSIAEEIHYDNSLEYIGVIGCENIQSLPQGLDKLRHLREIELVYCPSLTPSSESWLPTSNLKVLKIDACKNLQTLPSNFHNLASLERLEISNCSIREEGLPISLKELSISQHKTEKRSTLKEWELHELTSLETLTSLEMFTIEGGCPNAESFPPEELGMKLPPSLVKLTIKNFPKLQVLSSKHFATFPSIKYLSIMDCPKVRHLPEKDSLRSLNRLHIDDCPLLRRRCLSREWPKIAHVPYVRIDDKLLGKED